MTRRMGWIAAAAVLVVVAVLGAVGAGVWFASRPAGPDAVAGQYLDALAAGDGARALSLVDVADDERPIAVLDAATERISEVEVVAHGYPAGTDTAGVAVRFTLAGQRWDADLGLHRTAHGWRLDRTALGTIEVATDLGRSVQIGQSRQAAGTLIVLPAVYRVVASPADLLVGQTEVTAVPAGVSADTSAVHEATIDASFAPGATALAQDRLDAYAAACAESAERVVEACGLLIPWTADFQSLERVAYRIERTPTLTLNPDDVSFDAAGGVLVATVTGTTHGGAAASLTYRDDDWALRGVVRVDADGLTLGVR